MTDDKKYQGCTRKQPFSFEKAESVAYGIRRRTGRMSVAYKCLFCESHHIGHPSYNPHSNRGTK